jgi:hypothetical protein
MRSLPFERATNPVTAPFGSTTKVTVT